MAGSDFSYYELLEQARSRHADLYPAIAFTRCFVDLAQRCLAAQAAQAGRSVEYPAGLNTAALECWLSAAGENESAADAFLSAAPVNWCEDAAFLAPLAGWLHSRFDHTDPASGSIQVWVDRPGSRRIRLYGPQTGPPPPPPFEWQARPPLAQWLEERAQTPAAILAHYDVHGVSMLALTLRYLRGLGFSQVATALSFEWTGDISKLWKRAVPKTLEHEAGYSTVVMVDCSVHSRTPEYTYKALSRVNHAAGQKLVIVDHHSDTFLFAPDLLQPGVELVLTDIFSCGLTESWTGRERELMALGALGDKVPEVFRSFPPNTFPQLHAANDAYAHRTLLNSPTPAALKDAGLYPLQPLWEALAADGPVAPELADTVLGAVPQPVEPPLPFYEVVGRCAVVTERLTAMGRAWYSLLERIMDAEDVPYAIATRLLNGRNANSLLLTRWQALDQPPVRLFIPAEYESRLLGHSTAVWADIPREQARRFLGEVLAAMHGGSAPANMPAALSAVEQNILAAAPVSIEERNAHHAPAAGGTKPSEV